MNFLSTPQTDSFANQLRGLGTGYYQALDFARGLERDLITAKETIEACRERIRIEERRADGKGNRLAKERAEAHCKRLSLECEELRNTIKKLTIKNVSNPS